jgi:hypothetical protein
VELSSGDDDVPKVLAGDDAEGEGATSVEQIAPKPTSSSALKQTKPSAADVVAPFASGQKWKRLLPLPKRKLSKPSADQVMTQIDLPPYHRPQSPLDLIPIEIIFGHLFKAFQCAS